MPIVFANDLTLIHVIAQKKQLKFLYYRTRLGTQVFTMSESSRLSCVANLCRKNRRPSILHFEILPFLPLK